MNEWLFFGLTGIGGAIAFGGAVGALWLLHKALSVLGSWLRLDVPVIAPDLNAAFDLAENNPTFIGDWEL